MAAMIFKVALLTLKTAAKPLATRFEKVVMSHPVWRTRVIDIAQASHLRGRGLQRIHRMEVGITRGAEGRTGKAFVASMTEEKAMELASKVVSEGFLYGMGVVLLGVELHRKNKEDAVKKEKEAAERQAIRDLHERHLRAEKASCCMEDLREELRTIAKQLHGVDERLQFMEQQMGRRRSWLPLFG
ncbi:hypothetical protein CHLNCDRAFT_143552 [Chlorella variabilis]|uniref:OPA3-like protein n=1 Tax=Chlorella variabilis TaxID=554065 RepID=E1ZB58_CHLVA|nr:hypothetical protein CHLNCDRAFT_143552 [Chlorella variabilis]EFN57171.1 hypothetical protein CHLNCDRAFT_143552 [Chlorella variabilis]|eukprot:XP_005849273.1 hypothetical protein CHLNCDRAFT_143552 [Chlorella variabilis]